MLSWLEATSAPCLHSGPGHIASEKSAEERSLWRCVRPQRSPADLWRRSRFTTAERQSQLGLDFTVDHSTQNSGMLRRKDFIRMQSDRQLKRAQHISHEKLEGSAGQRRRKSKPLVIRVESPCNEFIQIGHNSAQITAFEELL